MPLYSFENKKTGENIEIFQHMKDEHVYVDELGMQWTRVYFPLGFSIDSLSEIDPYDSKDFAKKTGDKKGTYGDLLDASRELSDKRADRNGGYDEIKEKYFENYAKKRNGKKHKEVRLRELKSNLDKVGIELEN